MLSTHPAARYHLPEVRCPLLTTARVPAALAPVTTVGAEVHPRDVGVYPASVARIWHAVE